MRKGCMGKASSLAACSPPLAVAAGSQRLSLTFGCPDVLTCEWGGLDPTCALHLTPPAEAPQVSFQLWFLCYSAFLPSKEILRGCVLLNIVLVASRSQNWTSFLHKETSPVQPGSLRRPGPTPLSWSTPQGAAQPQSCPGPPPVRPRTSPRFASGSSSQQQQSRPGDTLQRSPPGHF